MPRSTGCRILVVFAGRKRSPQCRLPLKFRFSDMAHCQAVAKLCEVSLAYLKSLLQLVRIVLKTMFNKFLNSSKHFVGGYNKLGEYCVVDYLLFWGFLIFLLKLSVIYTIHLHWRRLQQYNGPCFP